MIMAIPFVSQRTDQTPQVVHLGGAQMVVCMMSRAVCGGAARLRRQGGVTSQLLIVTLPVIPVFRKPILERPSRLPVIVTSI